MRLPHVKGKLPLLLLLLTPSVLMAIGLMWFNTLTLNQLEARNKLAQETAEHSMRDLAQLNLMSSGMLAVHRQVTNVLEEASNGRLSEAKAYAIHTRLVDELATMAPLEAWLSKETTEHADWRHQETALALKAFMGYRDHVLMATDIVAIDPAQAKRYVTSAFDRYLDFAARHQKLSAHITNDNAAALVRLAAETPGPPSQRVVDHTGRVAAGQSVVAGCAELAHTQPGNADGGHAPPVGSTH